jgi:hypothetical protein
MLDPFWKAAWAGVRGILRDGDIIVAPHGDWPSGRFTLRPYRGAIMLDDDATVLFLHKGQIASIRRPDLADVMLGWQCVFANSVFVCFTRERRLRIDRRIIRPQHMGRLYRYLHAPRLKRRRSTLFLLHIPKTAGTSLWDALRRHMPSSIYYDSVEAFLHNPPAPGDYDLVGGHIPLRFMAPYVAQGGRIICTLRHPTDRFRAAFLHARRTGEDVGTFTPTMRLLRELPLREALKQPAVIAEIRQQLIMLGQGFRPYDPDLAGEMFTQATAWMENDRHLFGTVEDLPHLGQVLKRRLGLSKLDLGHLNRSHPQKQAKDYHEFEGVRGLVDELNWADRLLHAKLSL